MNARNYLFYTLLAGSTVLGASCSNTRETLTEDSTVTGYESEAVPGAYNATSAELLNQKAELRNSLNDQLDKVDEQIEALEDEAKSLSASAQDSYQKTIDDLDVQRERIVDQYRQLDAASSTSWDNVKDEIGEVMQDVDQKMTTLVAELKN
jgi:chromosome segregation ATPase